MDIQSFSPWGELGRIACLLHSEHSAVLVRRKEKVMLSTLRDWVNEFPKKKNSEYQRGVFGVFTDEKWCCFHISESQILFQVWRFPESSTNLFALFHRIIWVGRNLGDLLTHCQLTAQCKDSHIIPDTIQSFLERFHGWGTHDCRIAGRLFPGLMTLTFMKFFLISHMVVALAFKYSGQ